MTEKEQVRAHVHNWQVASQEIDRLRAEELGAMSADESARLINDVMLMADHWLSLNGPQDRDCGLVEQQRIFRKWKTASI